MNFSFLRFPVFILLAIPGCLMAQTPATERAPVMLPTSKMLTVPAPGKIGSTNGFAGAMVLSPDGHYVALLHDGYGTQETNAHQSISVMDLKTNQIADFPDQRFGTENHQSYFVGLAFSSDGKHLYASVGSLTDPTGATAGDLGNGIAVYSFHEGKVASERFIPIAPQPLSTGKKVPVGVRSAAHSAIPYPAGIAVIADHGHDKLLVANNLADNVVLLDSATGKILQTFDLSTGEWIPTSYPYTCVATKDGRRAWCSLWNASSVAELDLTSGKVEQRISLQKPSDPLAPGSHPTALLLSPDEKALYVALSNSDKVAVLTVLDGSISRIMEALPAQKYSGAFPTALAQSADGKRLFVADSGMDAVAILDTGEKPATLDEGRQGVLGFVPTDWYPTAIVVHGDELLIASSKGEGARPNNGMGKTDSEVKRHRHPYIPTLLKGSIARLNIPATIEKLPELTRVVENDNLFHSDPGTIAFRNGQNPIKHVIYVIKENRTFDQILGDLKVGDGDPSLTMYGEDITPNEHKLARQFGVLDNFYDSGEVSGDGHLWSTAAVTTDYNEKTWQIAYRGKERTYDFQGQVADEYPLEHKVPDIDDPSTGFLWDNLARNNVTYRDYGEYVNAVWCNERHKAANPKQGTPSGQETTCPRTELHQGDTLPPNVGDPHGGTSPWPWPVPLFDGVKPTKAVLRDHFDPLYPDFNTDYPDQLRADEFLNEFGAFVRARQENEGPRFELPQFVLLYFPDDHTGGTRPDRARPAANVADNDLALGRVVDAVSHSPYWDDTAIFVLEDDAQDGADHVDAHRSTAFVISKYSPGSSEQPYVEHHFYTTVNTIHTMETLLGLPPMNQNDAYAPVMGQMFSGAGDQPPYKADYRNLKNSLIYETNKHDAPGAKISLKMDFSRPDQAGAARLNRVLWQDQKGSAPMPQAKHTVFAAGSD
ncbi:MAG TPA: bifunctional YncE family protein/alkaline phosphatase family protein [Candidatus Sulfotelmatobacter sp.]|nr:bifunctional YncE family protein/alkaline phosphatase family protein [Candidatus Sulfotelmatobacter sp.]